MKNISILLLMLVCCDATLASTTYLCGGMYTGEPVNRRAPCDAHAAAAGTQCNYYTGVKAANNTCNGIRYTGPQGYNAPKVCVTTDDHTTCTLYVWVRTCDTGDPDPATGRCYDAPECSDGSALCEEKNQGEPLCNKGVGNPCNPATGNKYQKAVDLEGSAGALSIVRHYNSSSKRDFGIGVAWSMRYLMRLDIRGGGNIRINREDGYSGYFDCTSSPCLGDVDSSFRLDINAGGYVLTDNYDSTEQYDSSGKLLSISDIRGNVEVLVYDSQNHLEGVEGSTGKYLNFGYDSNERINTITDEAGRVWAYQYDADGNLEYVNNPDKSIKQYHYNEAQYVDTSLPHALTGISDERLIRYATFEYDNLGRATATYHAGNVDRVDIAYNDTEGTRTITNSRGYTSTYQTAVQLGVAHVYDISGPACATCGSGNSKYDYDAANNNLRSKTENGLKTIYGNFDDNGKYLCKVEGVSIIDTTTGECEFDPVTSPDARRTVYTYDPRFSSRIATLTEPSVYNGNSRVTTYTYDDYGNRTMERVDGYHPDGSPVSRTITYQHEGPLHQLSQIDGPRTDVSDITLFEYYPVDHFQYSDRARLRRVVTADGTLLRDNIRYTSTGKVWYEFGPNNNAVVYSYYPGNDRLQALHEYDMASWIFRKTAWTYLPTGEVETITIAADTPDAITLSFTYDDARRLKRVTNGLGDFIEFTLDTEGNLEAENYYDSNSTLKKSLSQAFDIYNRLDLSSQENEIINYEFSPNGMLAQQIDGEGVIVKYQYDDLKRLLTRTHDLNGTDTGTANAQTLYAYDVADRLTSVTDPNNGNTIYTYDDLGNLTSLSSPDTGTVINSYDSAGNLRKKQNANSQNFIYTYDILNRVTGIDAPGITDDITFTYDACENGTNRLCTISRDITSIDYLYNPFGEVTSISQSVITWPGYQKADSNMRITYNLAGKPDSITYPSGSVVSYLYNAAGQLSDVELDTGGATHNILNNARYLPFGPLAKHKLGNGIKMIGIYDQAYRPHIVGSSIFYDALYYDAKGNAIAQYKSGVLHKHNYDALSRLYASSESGSNNSFSFTYDMNGNRTEMLNETETITYSYENRSNRIAAVNGDSTSLDLAGNPLRWNKNTLSYTADNRLKKITGLAEYTYNGLGQRVLKTTITDGSSRYTNMNGQRVFVYGDDGSLMAETGPTGQVMREYIYVNGQLFALIDHKPSSNELFLKGDMDGDGTITIEDFLEWFYSHFQLADVTYDVTGDGVMNDDDVNTLLQCAANAACTASSFDTSLYYAHNDHLGTPHALTDETGEVVWQAAYDPFGQATVTVNDVEMNVRFPGQYHDVETGLHYNYHRFYDPGTGRYLTPDPIGLAGGLNTYGYAGGNPLRWTDRLGLDAPGCDRIPVFLESNCMLNMCSKHDYCYFKYRCSATSWGLPLSKCNLKCNLPAIGGTLCAAGFALTGQECALEPDLTPRIDAPPGIPKTPLPNQGPDIWEWE